MERDGPTFTQMEEDGSINTVEMRNGGFPKSFGEPGCEKNPEDPEKRLQPWTQIKTFIDFRYQFGADAILKGASKFINFKPN